VLVFIVLPSLVADKADDKPVPKIVITMLVDPPVEKLQKPDPPKTNLPGDREVEKSHISPVITTVQDDPNAQHIEFEADVRHELPVVLSKFHGTVAVVESEDFKDFNTIKGTPLMASILFRAPEWSMTGSRGGPKQNVTGNYRLVLKDWDRDPEVRKLVTEAGYNRQTAEVVLLFPYESKNGFDDYLKKVIEEFALSRASVRDESHPPRWKYVRLAWSAEVDAGVRVLDVELASLPAGGGSAQQ
jgi:hypothetical protein